MESGFRTAQSQGTRFSVSAEIRKEPCSSSSRGQSLNGNTLKGEITVQAPVILKIPREKGVLRAQATTWLFRDQIIRSAKPFEADLERTRIHR